jgi:hypothetical protein
MSQADIEYYRRRAAEERKRAAEATDPHAARAHIKLAENYEGLLAHADMLPASRSKRA